jgi:hypothetical protein
MKIKKSIMLSDSLISKYLPADYSDVYTCEVDFEKEITPDDIMVNFWTDFPAWVNALFKLRDFMAKFVGLKTSKGMVRKELENCIRTVGTYSFMSVPAKNANETVILLSDKHLNAYLSIHIESKGKHKTISAITVVHFKNILGHIYFFVIKPFHGIIVRSMLKRAVNKAICYK